MTIVETVLVFAGIPLGLFLILAVAVFGSSTVRRDRYRPGRPWTHPTVWFLPHPSALADAPAVPERRALTTGQPHPETATDTGALGGASGEW